MPIYTFYTTPTSPYDIRYEVVMQQKDRFDPETAQPWEGRRLVTISDWRGNPWDMNPSQTGRQTRYTWRFGIDTASGNTTTTYRGEVELFE